MRSSTLFLVACACRFNFEDIGGGVDAKDDAPALGGEVELVVEGRGVVLVAGADPCIDRCTYPGPAQLTPQAAPGWRVEAISAPCSATQDTCAAPGGASITVTFGTAPITANRIFVTSQTVSAGIGIAGLDAACADAAVAGGLGGTFVAFASTSTVHARDRLAGARGWVRLDGLPLFDTVADLGASTLPRAVLYTELGIPVSDVVMTGSSPTGTATTHCSDWTNTGMYAGGTSGNAGPNMFSTGSGACQPRRIYCIERDRDVPVTLAAVPMPFGRVAFVTSLPVYSGGGIAAGDTACANEAAAAALPGSYRAWMATTTESANERVGGVGGLWKRTDGIVISWNGLDAMVFDGALGIDAVGGGHGGTAWLGATSHDVVGTAGLTCNDWTSSSNAISSRGVGLLTNQLSAAGVGATCAQPLRAICLQLP